MSPNRGGGSLRRFDAPTWASSLVKTAGAVSLSALTAWMCCMEGLASMAKPVEEKKEPRPAQNQEKRPRENEPGPTNPTEPTSDCSLTGSPIVPRLCAVRGAMAAGSWSGPWDDAEFQSLPTGSSDRWRSLTGGWWVRVHGGLRSRLYHPVHTSTPVRCEDLEPERTTVIWHCTGGRPWTRQVHCDHWGFGSQPVPGVGQWKGFTFFRIKEGDQSGANSSGLPRIRPDVVTWSEENLPPMVKQGGMSSAYPPPGARESTEEEEADPGVPFEHGMVQPGRKPPPQAWFQRQNMQGWMNRMAKPPAVPVHHAMPGPPPAGPPPHGRAGSLPTGPPPSGAGQGGLSSVNPPPRAGAAPKPMAEGYCRPTHKYGRYQAPAEAEGDRPRGRPGPGPRGRAAMGIGGPIDAREEGRMTSAGSMSMGAGPMGVIPTGAGDRPGENPAAGFFEGGNATSRAEPRWLGIVELYGDPWGVGHTRGPGADYPAGVRGWSMG